MSFPARQQQVPVMRLANGHATVVAMTEEPDDEVEAEVPASAPAGQ